MEPVTGEGMTYSCDSDDGFKEPYYDFDSELSVAPRRPRVGFQEADIRETPRKPRPKSACSIQSTAGKRERLRSLTKGESSKQQARCSSALGIRLVPTDITRRTDLVGKRQIKCEANFGFKC